MYKLHLTKTEKTRIKYYLQRTLYDKLHWGNGEVIISEENDLINQINSDAKILKINFTQLKILVNWFLETTYNATSLIDVDNSILEKLVNLVKQVKKKQKINLNSISEKVNFLNSIFEPGLPLQIKKNNHT